jgi:hypothetical protein
MFGACADAQPACVTIASAHRERLAISVDPRFHSRDQREYTLIVIVELVHFENLVGASVDAILFGLASRAIDHRREYTSMLLALGLQ